MKATIFPNAPAFFSTGKKRLVLLVDDDQATREYLRPSLETDHLTCITAGSVAEAEAALQQHEVALLVMDWGLDRSGADLLRIARDTRPTMPVVAISGLPFDVRTDAVMHKVDVFMSKPLSGAVLRTQVTQLLDRVADTPTPLLPERPEQTLSLGAIKSTYIRHVVSLFDGNVTMAARALGVHRQTVSAALEHEPGAGKAQTTNLMCHGRGE